ncbi:hypothetical protein [Rhizobacter sp. Root404]|jgi:hypothetical protein|uniref:hypothetical protein n=1 Tax=Rhizobacter sp. Root404 TaxID=1736528 RepID=UPI000A8E3179|nr:hypothetical protein [Rhizobacter sp. Root404]
MPTNDQHFMCVALLALLCLPVASGAQTPVPDSEASAPAVEAPRQLSEQDLAKLRRSVQSSKVRAVEEARLAELRRQEQARQFEEQRRQYQAQAARAAQEDARAEAEEEADRSRRAAKLNASRAASERALAQSMARLNDTANRVQAQQAQQVERQREQAEVQQRTERQRQVKLINQATQRQDEEAARLARQRQQSEQARADAQAAERAQTQRRHDEQSRQQMAAEPARQQEKPQRLQASTGSLTFDEKSRSPTLPAAVPATMPNVVPPSSPTRATRMFLGKSCADARAGAQTWVGKNGTFSTDREEANGYDGFCRLWIYGWSGSSGAQ